MAHIIDGKKIAKEMLEELRAKSGLWREKTLAAFLVGENKESESFLRQKEQFAKDLGIDFRLYKFSDELSNDALRKEFGRIVRGSRVGGAIVQLPLPEKYNEQAILNAIPKEKDVDCLSEQALGGFYTGRWKVLPPAVVALEALLHAVNFDLAGKKVAVVGKGKLIGRPITTWLLGRAAAVSSVYIQKDLPTQELADADLVVTGVGKSGLITGDLIRSGAGIVDFGYSYAQGKVRGDVDVENCQNKAAFITPTPGGTGPLVVAALFKNFVQLNGDPGA